VAVSASSLTGKRIAITGGARGIGLATARELSSRGAVVVIGDLDEVLAVQAAEQIGGNAVGLGLDVADAASFQRFIDTATADQPLDILINNAGIMPIVPFLEQEPEMMQRALEVNVLGCLHGMSSALPAMVERGAGHILNVASTAGKAPVPGGVVYCGSKSAVVAITETARVEYAGTGVHFTCVMPHFTNTELIAGTTATKLMPIVEPPDVAEAIARAIEKPAEDVFIPQRIGPILGANHLLGRRLRDKVNRRLGAYDTFLNFDKSQRSGYDARIRNP
jgi:NAD(P)-dependent dehydrogenase (short-subunit alcohol dehydrogenase family)